MAVPEYSGILALSEKYAEKDFEIILFPCNQVLHHSSCHTHPPELLRAA